MRILLLSGIVIVGGLTLTACGKSGSNAATFCPALIANNQLFAGTLGRQTVLGTREDLVKLARSTDKLAAMAPSQVRSSVRVEAAAYHKWANTGDMSVINSYPKLNQARSKLSYWFMKHCQK